MSIVNRKFGIYLVQIIKKTLNLQFEIVHDRAENFSSTNYQQFS